MGPALNPSSLMLLMCYMQDGGEDVPEAVVAEEAEAGPEAGMRKSARTEQVDFRAREEERYGCQPVAACMPLHPLFSAAPCHAVNTPVARALTP